MEALSNTLITNMLTSGLLDIILSAFGSSPPAPSHAKKQTWNLLLDWCPSTGLSLCSGWSECLLHSLEIVQEQRFLRPQVRMCYSGGVWLSVQTWLSCRYHHMLAAGTKTLTEQKSKDSLRRIIIFFLEVLLLPLECTYCDFWVGSGTINTWASLRFNWLGVILWQINVPLTFVHPTQVLKDLQIMNMIYLVLGNINNASLLIWF